MNCIEAFVRIAEVIGFSPVKKSHIGQEKA
jgi:hypothetical protein